MVEVLSHSPLMTKKLYADNLCKHFGRRSGLASGLGKMLSQEVAGLILSCGNTLLLSLSLN